MSSLQIPPSSGKPEDEPYFCRCEKCAPRGGRVLCKTTWYKHNPGGRGIKRPILTLEDKEYLNNLPAPKFSRIRQRRLEERRADPCGRISKRGNGSSSVRMTSVPIYALIFTKIHT